MSQTDAPDVDQDEFTRTPWIAPLASTVITLPVAFYALLTSMLMPMACDSCTEAEAHRFDASFGPAFVVSCCGLALSLCVLLASWVCMRRRPAASVLLAMAAPISVVFTWLLFVSLVDTP
ncbi:MULTISPECIES: hypothetical protein [unclassified Streptomyces]|uniref:hypothetical protein n=1 Tax=unclassified Streptomyces TaxID=2593676 RepID=UPI000DAB91E4|nr:MULTISPECIES: hypothetical protein [unclassified Streptomyces]PZT72470.1 hypothetical protein DNK55_28510 [Streptomyces sp. AC1-42T]PZT81212.1 hypothetical protein DNK56_03060 [Streptomyces sp. AC1-42W]